jgi:hypothetical protein
MVKEEEAKKIAGDKEKSEEYFSKDRNSIPEEDLLNLVTYTASKAKEGTLTKEEKQILEKEEKEVKFIEDYIKHYKIKNQDGLNYAIEHDEKFKIFLERIGRLEELYTGSVLGEIEEQREKIKTELIKESKKDKRGKIIRKFKRKKGKKQSNNLMDSKKELDLLPYLNKKLEKQGCILTFYLRKNGRAETRYVKMDEVGQIKVDGYVYHERDAIYRFGKKNIPVLIILEGSLAPVNKETLKEHLGCESAEAQKLIIKGIEQAEVVKAAGIGEDSKKMNAPPKWLIIVGIAVMIGLYAYFGGFR